MTEILITTQKELDKLKEVTKDQKVTIEAAVELKLNGIIEVYGRLLIKTKINTSHFNNRYFRAWGNSSVEAWGNSSVVAWENSSVVARGNSSVEAWGNSSVEARGNSSVVARGNSSVVARGNSSVVAWENSSVVAWENSSVEARGNSSVVAWGNSSVVAWENSSVVARGNSSVKIIDRIFRGAITLFAFAAVWVPKELNISINKKADTATVIKYELLPYLERNGVEIIDGKVILFKRVSHDFKTQENTKNETLWTPGITVTHPSWGNLDQECGEGKFHACSRTYFCDEFRSKQGDKYVAIEVRIEDLHEWKNNPQYPYKIAFRECVVLYECDKTGKRI